MKQLLVFQGPASSRSGYGDHSRDLLSSLIKMDRFEIKIFDMPGVVDKIMDDEDTSTTDIEKICVFDKKDVIDEVLKLHEAQSEIGYNRL